ncbi:MAG: UDP-N-acetylmuramoyl-tripeptide--D-alanyl-D-alanine ligase [Pseudobdellovibrio sp.]
MKWTLEQIKNWTGGKIVSQVQTEFSEIGTDTRKNLTGQVFVALKGDAYDAHQFLDQAVQMGAAALLVHELAPQFESLKSKVSIILVEDTLKALQNFSNSYRKTLKTKIIGITGSNGKTTTKEFTAQILSTYKKTHYSQGSFNNHWGVPMTLLSIPQEADFAVVEMGMNHAGEIAELVKIADPDIVVCTMVGSAHIEFFGTRQKIAEAKAEIYNESRPDTIRIFNQDQELTFDMMYPIAKRYPDSRMLSFSAFNDEADTHFKIVELKMKEIKISGIIAGQRGEATIPVFGKQNIINLMAAATIAYACKIAPEAIWKALPNCKTAWGRNQFIATHSHAEILFDGYNSNPDSMRALLENIPQLQCSGKKIGVFGQMKEQGAASEHVHAEIGELAGHSGFSQIYFIGEDAGSFEKGIQKSGFKGEAFIAPEFTTALGEKLGASVKAGDIVVVKGSRGAKTERFIPFCLPIDWVAKT